MRVIAKQPPVRNTGIKRALYDGRERIGSIEQRDSGEFIACDRQGRQIGSYDTALEAANAVTMRAAS
jgi:hypothetical protein